MQFPLWHSPPLEQVPPLAFWPVQTLPKQKLPGEQLPLPVHEVGQIAWAPSHTYGVQLGFPAEPAGMVVQVPNEPVTLHASHAWPHALLQQ